MLGPCSNSLSFVTRLSQKSLPPTPLLSQSLSLALALASLAMSESADHWLDTEKADNAVTFTKKSHCDLGDASDGVDLAVTNSDVTLKGPMLTAKLTLVRRRVWKFPGNVALGIHYKSDMEIGETGVYKQFASVIDGPTAARCFADAGLVADRLELSAAGLIKEWNAANGPAVRRGHREVKSRVFTLGRMNWLEGAGPRARSHETQLSLELSTFAATHKYQDKAGRVALEDGDVFVFLKFRSTKFAGEDQAAGELVKLGYDKNGLYMPAASFNRLLRSKPFQDAVADVSCKSRELGKPPHLRPDPRVAQLKAAEQQGKAALLDRFLSDAGAEAAGEAALPPPPTSDSPPLTRLQRAASQRNLKLVLDASELPVEQAGPGVDHGGARAKLPRKDNAEGAAVPRSHPAGTAPAGGATAATAHGADDMDEGFLDSSYDIDQFDDEEEREE